MTTVNGMTARRHFLALMASLPLGALPSPLGALRLPRRGGPHPTPRPGVDASKVLTAADLGGDAVVAFDGHGRPDSSGTVTLSVGGVQSVVRLDADTGEAGSR